MYINDQCCTGKSYCRAVSRYQGTAPGRHLVFSPSPQRVITPLYLQPPSQSVLSSSSSPTSWVDTLLQRLAVRIRLKNLATWKWTVARFWFVAPCDVRVRVVGRSNRDKLWNLNGKRNFIMRDNLTFCFSLIIRANDIY